MSKCRIKKEITLEDARLLASNAEMTYFGAVTPWWTFQDSHLYRPTGVPTDPRGGVLYQNDKPLEFLTAAENDPSHYGKYGLRTFLLAYHGCVVVNDGPKAGYPTCLKDWDEYEELLDIEEPTQ